LRAHWCILVGLVLPVSLQAQNYRLYVDNSNDQSVSVIDLNSLKMVDDIKIGAMQIHGLAVRPDGKTLFVTVESDHTLRIVDTATGETKPTIKHTAPHTEER